MYLLDNPTRSYAWGSRSVIPDLLGQPASDDPQAELWIGAHPDHPSRLVDIGVDLRTYVTDRPNDVLGDVVSETFDGMLPYLMKVLAVRSEEHTSELQSRGHLVCRLLLEKKKREL